MEMEALEGADESRHYGKRRTNRACTNCKAAKTKCIVNPGNNGSCERCSHFTLECVPALPAVRRRRQERTSRVSELEQKLDNIVTLLTNPQQQQIPPGPVGFSNSVPDFWASPESQDTSHVEPTPPYGDGGLVLASSDSQPYESPSTSNVDETPFPAEPSLPLRSSRVHTTKQHPLPPRLMHQLPLLDPDSQLSFFRNHLTEYFVFVVVPLCLTARELRLQEPFLMDAILLVASKQAVFSQKEASDKLLAYLSEHLLLGGEKSLDLLQGLLVYLAWGNWGNYQFHNSAQMSALLQLAVALVAELELGKIPCHGSDSKKSLPHATGLEASASAPAKASAGHSLEEMRAFLGCFYLSSIFSQCYKKVTGMKHTSYLEQCCQALDAAAEYPTDIYLTASIRIQLFLCKGLETSSYDEPDRPSAALSMYVKTLQKGLQEFRSTVLNNTNYTSRLGTDLLLLHLHSVEISLLEIGLYDTEPPSTQIHSLRHLSQLSSCLNATKDFFNQWFILPSTTYINLPIVAWAQLANAVMAMSKLVLLDHESWDLEHAREIADFGATLDRIAGLIEQNTEVAFVGNRGADAERAFLMYAKRLRWVGDWYEARVLAEKEEEERGEEVVGEEMSGVGNGNGEEGAVLMGDFMNVDDVFWQDFVGEWKGLGGVEGG